MSKGLTLAGWGVLGRPGEDHLELLARGAGRVVVNKHLHTRQRMLPGGLQSLDGAAHGAGLVVGVVKGPHDVVLRAVVVELVIDVEVAVVCCCCFSSSLSPLAIVASLVAVFVAACNGSLFLILLSFVVLFVDVMVVVVVVFVFVVFVVVNVVVIDSLVAAIDSLAGGGGFAVDSLLVVFALDLLVASTFNASIFLAKDSRANICDAIFIISFTLSSSSPLMIQNKASINDFLGGVTLNLFPVLAAGKFVCFFAFL